MVKIWYLLIFAYYTRSYLALHGLTLIFCVLTFIVFAELNRWSRPFCVFMSDLRDFLGQDWFQVMPNLLSSEGWGMALARPKASLSHCDWVWNQETNGIKGEGWENGLVSFQKSMSHMSYNNWRYALGIGGWKFGYFWGPHKSVKNWELWLITAAPLLLSWECSPYNTDQERADHCMDFSYLAMFDEKSRIWNPFRSWRHLQ